MCGTQEIPILSKMLIQKHHISGLHQCRKKLDVSPTLCKFFCQVCDHFDLHQFSCKCMQRFHNGFVIHWVCFYFLPSFKNVFCLLVIFINILAIAFNQYVNVCFCILHACLAHTLVFIICLLSQIFFWFFYICIFYKFYIFCLQGCTTRCSLAAGLRGNGGRMRKLRGKRENEEMERDSFSTFPHSLFISSLSIHFL